MTLENYEIEIEDGLVFKTSMTLNENIQEIEDFTDDKSYKMSRAADDYIDLVEAELSERLAAHGLKITYRDESRQSKSVYFRIAKSDDEDCVDPMPVRFSDHTDNYGSARVNIWWGGSIEDMVQAILEGFAKW